MIRALPRAIASPPGKPVRAEAAQSQERARAGDATTSEAYWGSWAVLRAQLP